MSNSCVWEQDAVAKKNPKQMRWKSDCNIFVHTGIDIELKEARKGEWCEQTKMSYFRRQMLCFFSLSNLLARKNSDRQMIHEQLIHFEYTEHVYFSISICFWPVTHAKFILLLSVYRFNSCLSIVLISISSKINSISP